MKHSCLFVLILLGTIGCQNQTSGPEMADVSGVITLNGKPLPDADVVFLSNGLEGYGRTNDTGHYSLVRGAPVGDCKVYVTKNPESGTPGSIDTGVDGMDDEQMRAMNATSGNTKQAKSLLPPEFSDPKQTRLSINVPSGGTNEANFNL